MRYRANKKVSRRRQQDPHQKQYAPLSFGGGHNEPRHEKTCFCNMRTTKTQISLCIHAVWSAPLLFAA